MDRKSLAVALVLSAPVAGLWMAGCGDDQVFMDTDAATGDSGPTVDAAVDVDAAKGDASTGLGCGDSTGAPERLLLTINGGKGSELAAFNVSTRAVDGRFEYPGSIGLTSSLGTDPYVLDQGSDVVTRMNAQRPWEPVSSWTVKGDDAYDGGMPNANPNAIVVPDCSKGYVFRYNRNKVAVIDTTQVADAGASASFIDLSSLQQANDTDGAVEMAGAVHVASKKRIYVMLGNQDLKKVTADGSAALCADTTASIIAIDTTTGTLASLGGTAPGGGIALTGYGAASTQQIAYDPARDRLLTLSAGCNTDMNGTPGAIQRRRIEEVDLATGTVRTLLSLDDQGFPSGLVYADGTHAAVTFFGQAFFWDPSQTKLGAPIPGGLDYGASDGKGNLVGQRATFLTGGGAGPIEIVSLPFGDAGADASSTQQLGADPYTIVGGFINGTEVWPHP